MQDPLDVVATTRLRAERLTAAHLPDIRRIHQDAGAMATLGGVKDEAQTQAWMTRNLAHWEACGFGMYVLWEAGGAEMVGRAGLRHLTLDGVDEVEVGYGFYPSAWGRGLATEIARAFLALGFDTLGLASIVALTLPTNYRSQRVMAKAGLHYERDLVHEHELHVLYRAFRPTPGASGFPPLAGA
jgi:RimJ/RimL family protein N-acetyltransferase